ncbi:50S ribosomal protein L25 [Alkaliphilus hydrothermalis]|uniref:Large ribosomal subunit protein bL25 n=1 Tax=Alkaliphilus hydrothermalis TaxID=1482730 RepID=A0ABS2NP27_9FIRM|nr:50S ribosomal protein L25 [Alkaliphilus hydrothermalis]MBM7614699.1 large subunit ribosomal protein L25 [Alkaliphilus hydrothermalis]
MATPLLQVYQREIVGKNSVAKQRKKGKIPGILYSRGKTTQLIFMKERDIEKILSKYGSTRIAVSLEGEKSFAVIKEIQRENLKNQILHVDLQTLRDDQKIKLTLPIHFVNREAVENSSQFLQTIHNEIDIQTYPKYIPDKIEVDAKLLNKKDAITVKDLQILNSEHIEVFLEKDAIIANMSYVGQKEEPQEEENLLMLI